MTRKIKPADDAAKKKTPKTAKPGTTDDAAKEKKAKKARIDYPNVGSPDPEVYPFKGTPDDFDFAKHKPLKKRDFVGDHLWYEHKAQEFDAKAARYRAEGEEAKKLGSAKDRAAAKRLQRMTSQMAQLKQKLAAQGVDVDALIEAAATKDS